MMPCARVVGARVVVVMSIVCGCLPAQCAFARVPLQQDSPPTLPKPQPTLIDPKELLIWSGKLVAPLEVVDIPVRIVNTRPQADADADAQSRERAAHNEQLAAKWGALRSATDECAALVQGQLTASSDSGLGIQVRWDQAQAKFLPLWIPRIEAANAAILKIACSPEDAAIAQRRAWMRCSTSSTTGTTRQVESAPAGIDVDLWLADLVRSETSFVAWLAPMFGDCKGCPEAWCSLRSDFGRTTLELRREIAQLRLAYLVRKAQPDLPRDERERRAALVRSAVLHARWRGHNQRYLERIDEFARETGHELDALMIRCTFLHAENPYLLGESARYAEALADANAYARDRDPVLAADLAELLAQALREYAHVTEESASLIVRTNREFWSWRAGLQHDRDDQLRNVNRAIESGTKRTRFMANQLSAALEWVHDDPNGELAARIRELRRCAEEDSWNSWRLLLDFPLGVLSETPQKSEGQD